MGGELGKGEQTQPSQDPLEAPAGAGSHILPAQGSHWNGAQPSAPDTGTIKGQLIQANRTKVGLPAELWVSFSLKKGYSQLGKKKIREGKIGIKRGCIKKHRLAKKITELFLHDPFPKFSQELGTANTSPVKKTPPERGFPAALLCSAKQ